MRILYTAGTVEKMRSETKKEIAPKNSFVFLRTILHKIQNFAAIFGIKFQRVKEFPSQITEGSYG